MAALAVRRARRSGPTRLPFRVCRVATDARPGEDGDIEPDEVTLILTLHEEEHGLHATISLPTEKIPAGREQPGQAPAGP
ncbi:hypothetical protein [Actinomadura sp. WMMA1423]|uniref:hypothetical protein n=1 Tax=Actinomadura sp. WMMA1423 TaxID=2591108 RepID=UPI0011468DF1|nr:hypothetical protein [Actinomadura sp. WMMA1423]